MRNAVIGSTLLLWATAAVALWSAVATNAHFLHDDAFITLRYAQNLLAGNGIGWNPGDRVEGYTNFLHLALVSGLGATGVDLVSATRVVAAGSYAALLAFLVRWIPRRLRGGEPRARAGLEASLPLVLIVTSGPLVAWGFGGLEAPLLCLLVTIGVALLRDALDADGGSEGHVLGSGVAFSLACMTRPDAAIFVAVALGFLLASSGGRRRARFALLFLLPFGLLVGPWLVWKAAYYGSVVPNTFYVKAAGPSWDRFFVGLRYVRAYALAPPFVLLLLLLGALRAAVRGGIQRGTAFGLTAVGAHLAWVCYVGGDQMPLQRLLVPVIPTALWLTFDLWAPDLRRLGAVALGAVALAVSVLLLVPVFAKPAPTLNSTAFVGAAVGRHIASAWSPGSLVALNTAGSTPYYAPRLRYLDMLGLNDAHIARRSVETVRIRGQLLPGHAKGDGAYVLAQRPDYIILGPANGVPASHPWFLSDLEISEAPEFRRDYELRQARIDVRGIRGWKRYPETRSGELLFTWYARRR